MTRRAAAGADAPPSPRRPQPPAGFRPFKWKTKRVGPPGDQHSAQLCPVCGNDGSCWEGGGFTDPEAQRLADGPKARRLQGAGDPSVSFEGVPILMHWSRFATGSCMTCGCRYWHDFVEVQLPGKRGGGWAYYYGPAEDAGGQYLLFPRGT